MNDMKEIIEEIKSRCDIVSVISDYINVDQSGSNFKGLCPFHGEKTPSFYISHTKQMYKCFGCGEGGDVINFVMKIENLEFIDSVKFLAKKYGIDINTNINEETKKQMEKINRFQEIYLESARYYLNNLLNTKNRGYTYLRNRGLSDKIIKKFGLGYSIDSWDNLLKYLNNKGYSSEELYECGLISYKKETNRYYDKFRNRVMFPIFDYRGNVIGFGGRVLDESLPKYLNSPESILFNKSKNLYGLNFSRKNIKDKTIVLVEGYMDLISLYQYDIKNVAATLGTALTKEQGLLLKRYVENVIIAYDSDEAGIKATLRAIDILTPLGITVKILSLRECKDPDEFIRKYGINEYNNMVKTASHYIKYKIDTLKRGFTLNNDEDKVKFAKESSKIIKQLKSHVEIDFYSKYLSQLINIDVESIKREVYGKDYVKHEKFNNKNKSNIKYEKTKRIIEKPVEIKGGKKLVEETLIKAMINNKNVRNICLMKVSEEDFLLKDSKEILKYIIKNRELDKITIDKIKSLNISEIYLKDLEIIEIDNMNFENVNNLNQIIHNVKKNTINDNINKLLEEQKNLENNKNDDTKEVDVKVMEIALQIVELQRKLQKI